MSLFHKKEKASKVHLVLAPLSKNKIDTLLGKDDTTMQKVKILSANGACAENGVVASASLEDILNGLVGRIDKIEKDNVALKSDNTTLNCRLAELEKTNASLKLDNTTLNSRLAKLEIENTTLNGRLNEVQDRLSKVEETLYVRVGKRASTLKKLHQEHRRTISSIPDEVPGKLKLKEQLAETKTQVELLEKDVFFSQDPENE